MSISFNHPANTVTSTGTLSLNVTGGSPTAPQPIRLNATSMIVPVRALPSGEAGAMVFDTGTRTLKYHDGTSWVEVLARDTILSPIYLELTNINNKLNGKLDAVTYSSSTVPSASISGTTLNIVFPLPGGGSGTGPTGLFTSSKPGSIMQYALTSGQTVTGIRTQMSGSANGQGTRTGTQANPWVTSDGWTLGDGMWWTWAGANGTITKQVPNINRGTYFKSINIASGGVTRIDNVIVSSATIGETSLTIAQLPVHSFSFSGQTNMAGSHVHVFPLTNDKGGTGRADGGNANRIDGNQTTDPAGDHIHTFSGTTNVLGSGQGHGHSISNIEVSRFEVAYLYNIAEPTFALSETVANSRYVLKSGDTMTGALSVASAISVRSNDVNLAMYWRNNTNGERAAITHSSSTNTLRLRSSGGTEVVIGSNGSLQSSSLSTNQITCTTINATAITGTSLQINGQITATGDIWAFSDKRLKENIKYIENSLDIVDSISGVTGNFIGETRVRSMVIAQEVQEVFPEAVSTDESGMLKVNYDGLIPVLLNAISDLRAEIKDLRSKM